MFSDIIIFLKSLSFIDYIFFFTVVFLIVLIVSLIYFIKINGTEMTIEDMIKDGLDSNKNSDSAVDVDNDLKDIATALKDFKPVNFTPYEKEEEEKAIISYDELLSNTGQFELNYSEENQTGDVLVKKVDLNNLINTKKSEPVKMEIHLMSLAREEEFLKTLKELQKNLN